jgi:Ca2+-binding EF-hand superfamily protein
MMLNPIKMATCIIFSLSCLLTSDVLAQEGAKCNCKNPVTLAVLLENQAVKIHLEISVDEQSLSSVWDESFHLLHRYFDRNHDGSIDEAESKLLPSTIAFRHAMGNGFLPPAGVAPKFADLDSDHDGKVDIGELKSHYHRAGVDRTRIGIGHLPWSQELSQSILKQLGISSLLPLEETKWRTAWNELLKLDANDDELIGAGELVAGAMYPGVSGTTLIQPIQGITDTSSDGQRVVLIELDPMISMADYSQILSKKFSSRSIDWQAWLTRRSDACWQIELKGEKYETDKTNRDRPLAPVISLPEDRSFTYSTKQLFFEGWQADGRIFEALRAARESIEKQLQSPQTDNDSSDRRRGGSLDWLLPIADQNCNGALEADEIDAWFAVQTQLARGQVLVTLLDQGDLFEMLDTNHDGALSSREVRNAPQIVQQMPLATSHSAVPSINNFAPSYRAIVSRGYSQSIRRPLESGPAWFQAMDRNSDGDISQREFTGPLEAFKKLDKDQNLVVDPLEARTAIDTGKK